MTRPILLAGLLSLTLAMAISEASAQGGRGGEYVGPGSGTGLGRYVGPGSGTGLGRCRRERVQVCTRGRGDGRGPRCRIEERVRC
jgi:hypothetical protein